MFPSVQNKMDFNTYQTFIANNPAAFTCPPITHQGNNVIAGIPQCSGMERLPPRYCDKIDWLVAKRRDNFVCKPAEPAMYETAAVCADRIYGKPECCPCGCNRVTWKGQRTLDQKTVLVALMVYIYCNLPERIHRCNNLMEQLATITSRGVMVRKRLPVPRSVVSGGHQCDEMDVSFYHHQGATDLQQQSHQQGGIEQDLCHFLQALTM